MKHVRWPVSALMILLVAMGCAGQQSNGRSSVRTQAAPQDPATTEVGRQMIQKIKGASSPVSLDNQLLDDTGMQVAWSATLPKENISNIWLIEGMLFVEAASSRLYCLDAESGYIRWVYSLRSGTDNHPAMADGSLYISAENTLHCIDLDTGYALWRAETEFLIASAPFVADKLYFGSWDWSFYAAAKKKAFRDWRVGTGGIITSRGYFADDTAYFGSEDGKVCAYQPKLRENAWCFDTKGPIRADIEVNKAAGLLYVGSDSFSVYAISITTGVKKWRFRCEGPMNGNMQLVDDALYVAAQDDGLYALDKATGQMLWFVEDGAVLAALTGGHAYVGLTDNRLAAVDRATGKLLWTEYSDSFRGYCAAGGSSMIFALAGRDKIVALRQSSLPQIEQPAAKVDDGEDATDEEAGLMEDDDEPTDEWDDDEGFEDEEDEGGWSDDEDEDED